LPRLGRPVVWHCEYLAWKMYTNYDGVHDRFGTVSVSDTNNGNSNPLFQLRCAQLNRHDDDDHGPEQGSGQHGAVKFNLSGFSATSLAYTLFVNSFKRDFGSTSGDDSSQASRPTCIPCW